MYSNKLFDINNFDHVTVPQEVFAGTPTYQPVLYHYMPDHLGSSSILTDRDGDLVQHYVYKPYGDEQYKNNTSANPSQRYIGQMYDMGTYKWRYEKWYAEHTLPAAYKKSKIK